MQPTETGKKYDKIAQWWHEQHLDSAYGVKQIEKALGFCVNNGKALDVGCGAGGRYIRLLEHKHFAVTGIDVSVEMIKLARQNHAKQTFDVVDICSWDSEEKFDFIVAWDSIFHLPLEMHKPVIIKLSKLLSGGGVLIYTFGNAVGEHTDQWRDDTFYYSSIGIRENVRLLLDCGLNLLHLELDQYPERHVCVIAAKPQPES